MQQKSIVKVFANVSYSTSNGRDDSFISGTGFVVSLKKNFIVTNSHIASNSRVQTLYVELYNQEIISANLIYEDPEHDFSVLKTTKSLMSSGVSEVRLSNSDITNKWDSVYSLSSSSISYGYILTAFASAGIFNSQVIVTDFPSDFGKSGSPLFNSKGEVIGLGFTSNKVYSAFLKVDYIRTYLSALLHNELPDRRSTGIVFEYCDLQNIAPYIKLSEASLLSYKENYSTTLAICVTRITKQAQLSNSPVQLMDVVLDVNDHKVAPHLSLLHKTIDYSEEIKMRIIRNSEEITLSINSFNLRCYEMKYMVLINGAMLYQSGYKETILFDIAMGKLFVSKIEPEEPLATLSNSQIDKISSTVVNSFNDFLQHLCDYVKEGSFIIQKRSFEIQPGYNNNFFLHHALTPSLIDIVDIVILFIYNNTKKQWEEYEISHDMCDENLTIDNYKDIMKIKSLEDIFSDSYY